MTATCVDLAPEAMEAIARRVAALLADPPPAARLVDAAEVADLLGVARSWVYDNAERLGAVRIGDGPRGRLRFNVDRALTAWRDREPEPEPEPQPRAPRRRATTTTAALLPIKGPPHDR
jgi:hypothetical protein